MKSVKATVTLFTYMNTKDITTKPFIKTLSTTLACLVASSAFALDDRFDNPKPEDEPEPKPQETPDIVELPDLVPLHFDLIMDQDSQYFHHYKVKATVANYGKADAGEFYCHFGMRVLETKDPVKYPVGFTDYIGLITYDDGLKVMEMAEPTGNWMGIYIPKEVTKVAIYLVVDRNWNYLGGDFGNWDDDAGKELEGSVKELKESNNVLGPEFRYYYEYQYPETTVEVPKGILVKPKGRE